MAKSSTSQSEPQDKPLSYERLHELLRFDPNLGLFYWRTDVCGNAQAGMLAGSISEGRVRIQIDGRSYYANQLAWFYLKGVFPKLNIDHKNRDRFDDRPDNLREATNSQNGANAIIRGHNRSGLKGVTVTKHGTFQARIRHHGKLYNLGMHPTKEAAHAAYLAKARELFGEFARS